MPPRKILLAAPLSLLVLLLVAACGGGDDDDGGSVGQLSDPNNVPTATAWVDVPDLVLIDPNNIVPLPPVTNDGDGGGDEPTPVPGEPGVCGQTYTVEAGDTTFGIADKCGVTVEGIEALNPEVDIRNLSIGDILIMPDVEAVDPEEELDPEEVIPEEEPAETEPPAEEPTAEA
jgi:LysM repeat protein